MKDCLNLLGIDAVSDKVIHITHNDADGVGCAVVAAILLPEYDLLNNTYLCAIGEHNEKLNEILDEYDDNADIPNLIIVSDLCLDKSTLFRVNEYYKKGSIVLAVDHHETNNVYDIIPNCTWYRVCKDKIHDDRFKDDVLVSATYLLNRIIRERKGYDNDLSHIFNGRNKVTKYFDTMVDMISRYDTWEWKNHPYDYTENDSELASVTYNEDIYSVITKFMGPDRAFKELYEHFYAYTLDTINLPFKPTPIPSLFTTIYDIDKDNIQKYLSRLIYKAKVYNKDDKAIACFIAENGYVNEAASYIYNNYNIDYVEIYYPSSNSVSYRTKRDDINLGKMAENNYNGTGGGHSKSAGTKNIPNDVYARIMDRYFNESISLATFAKLV